MSARPQDAFVGEPWTIGIQVRWEQDRLWAWIHFENDGHAGHPEHLVRGGLTGEIRCRYGLGPGHPETIAAGLARLRAFAEAIGMCMKSVHATSPEVGAIYIQNLDEEGGIIAANLVRPFAKDWGWLLIREGTIERFEGGNP